MTTPDALDRLREEAAKPVCDCGDPRCVYAKNLLAAVETVQHMTAGKEQR